MTGDGDDERFEQAYVAHFGAILRYCLRRTSREQALDAAAETFAVAWRRRRDVPWDRPLPWLFGVAGKVLTGQRRSWFRQIRVADRLRANAMAGAVDPESVVVRRVEEEAVLVGLARLKPADREVILLAAWEQLSRDDLAAALGCTPNAASKRLGRAVTRLASELGTTRMAGFRFFRDEGRAT